MLDIYHDAGRSRQADKVSEKLTWEPATRFEISYLHTSTPSIPAERNTLESHVRSTEGADETLLKLVFENQSLQNHKIRQLICDIPLDALIVDPPGQR